MKQLRIAGVVTLVAGCLALQAQVGAQTSRTAEMQFKAAQYKQEVQGDLKGAIEEYKKIAQGPDRALAARALFAMGVTYQTLGAGDPRGVFAQIVRDYMDQKDVAAAARTRLAAFAAPTTQAEGSSPRRVMTGDMDGVNDVSRDGRLMVTTEGPSLSRLVIRDLLTNQTTILIAGSTTAWGRRAVFSADAQYIAYSWVERRTGTEPLQLTSLKVVGTGTDAQPRTLVGPDPRGRRIAPVAWSPDGRAILSFLTTDGAGSSLAWVSVVDGTLRTIKTFEPWEDSHDSWTGLSFSLSPDGGSIAYSGAPREGSNDRYIYVIDANGQNETAVVKMAGSNTQPLWTPDGTHILFVGNRSGSRDLLAVAVQGGVASGEPARLQSGFTGYPAAVSRSGDLYYVRSDDGGFAELIAERNPAGARIVQTFKGQSGNWSRGNQLAFVRPLQFPTVPGHDLIVRSIETGEERLYQHAGITYVSPRWLHDDTGIIVYVSAEGDGRRPGGSFYLVDVKTAAFKWLFAKDTADHVRSAGAALSPDSKTLYMSARRDAQAPWTEIVGVDLATGVERPIVRFPGPGLVPDNYPGLAVSPDGSTLVLQAWADSAKTHARLITVRVDGTGYRELYGPFAGGGWAGMAKWTPDGQSILFVADGNPSGGGGWRVMRIPATGGQPELDGLESTKLTGSVPVPRVENVANIDVSPDGSRIVFCSRTTRTFDVWMLENVKSLLSSAR